MPTHEIIEDDAAGWNENLKPNAAPASEEGNQEVETQVIDSPPRSQAEKEEQLAFINHLHETIMKVELNSTKKSVEKDKSQTKLQSFLKPPGSHTKK